MATETKTVESKVAQVDIDLDSLFDGAAGADSVTVPEKSDKEKKSIFSKTAPDADFSFTDMNADDEDDANDLEETEEDSIESKSKESAEDVFAALEGDDEDEIFGKNSRY